MHSRRLIYVSMLLAFAFASSLVLSGCGILGDKDELSRLLDYNPDAVGCLNELGPRFQAYYRGDIQEEKWIATWDCGIDSLNLFKKFVKSSDARGYTQDDLRAFVSRFLFTAAPVTPELVRATFELKSSLFGGSREIITPEEMTSITDFLQTLKIESTRLLPNMTAKAREPSPSNLLELTDALSVAGERVADSLHTAGNPIFTWNSAQAFVNEVAKLLHLDLPPDAIAWLSAVKVLFASGTRDGIEAEAWPRVVNAAVAYGGPAIAIFSVESKYLKGPNAAGEFGMKLAWKIKSSLDQTLDLYGGALPLTALDSVIDALPPKWITIDRAAIKGFLRPVASRILRSRVPQAIDHAAISLIFAKLDAWTRGQSHLEKIYQLLEDSGSDSGGATAERFAQEAMRYAEGLTVPGAKAEVYRLISLARQITPMFLGTDKQITFTPSFVHSLHDMSQIHWMRMVAEHMIKSYTTLGAGADRGSIEDLKALVADITPIGFAFGFIDPTVKDLHLRRFREANLFTYAANGDKFFDLDEATYYIGYLYSAAFLSSRIIKGVDARCPSLGKDVLGFDWHSAECFREEFYGNFRTYWDHFPQLVRFYENLTSYERVQLQKAMERGARRYGYTDQPVARYDIDGLSGVMQYIEAMFARFDDDGNQALTLSEVMRAYPVFRDSLVELSKGKLDPGKESIVEAAFTYTVHNGRMPAAGFKGTAAVLAWLASKPFGGWKKIRSNRLVLYGVIGSIAEPEPIPGTSPLPIYVGEPGGDTEREDEIHF